LSATHRHKRKEIFMNRAALVLVLLLLIPAPAAIAADDAVKAAPAHFKVLLENDEVRVLEYRARAGDKIGLHSHPAHVIISKAAGTTIFTLADGSTRTAVIKDGEVGWAEAVTHSQEAVTDGHVIVVELKKKAK
jgi:quercetin dioxygenase-like cupin family protein